MYMALFVIPHKYYLNSKDLLICPQPYFYYLILILITNFNVVYDVLQFF